jgi:protein involved in polysaccharide export with SLBB domain
VLTEEDGTCKAEYIRTPFAEFSESAPEILLPPDQIAVMGTVKRPGIFTLASDDRLTLEQALELAGGLHEGDWINSPAASPRNIRLHREVDGQKKTFKLDGSNVRGKRGTDLDFLVQPGDKIYVPYLF